MLHTFKARANDSTLLDQHRPTLLDNVWCCWVNVWWGCSNDPTMLVQHLLVVDCGIVFDSSPHGLLSNYALMRMPASNNVGWSVQTIQQCCDTDQWPRKQKKCWTMLDGDFDLNQNPPNIIQHHPTCLTRVFKRSNNVGPTMLDDVGPTMLDRLHGP